MTNLTTFFSNRAVAALCALLFSATMVVGAVGPAFDGAAASQVTRGDIA